MKNGDKFVVELEYRGDAYAFSLVGANDVAFLYEDCVTRAAAAYAAKGAPAPVSTAWEPKRDEVVLVEMEFVREKADGEVYVQKGDGNFIAVPRSAIVGPAPVRARFAVGDVVVYVPTVEVVIIREVNEIAGCYRASQDGRPTFIALEADLLTLDEARERLSNNR